MRIELAVVFCFFALVVESARAAVQVTKLDPPMVVSAWQEAEGPDPINAVAVDFNHDGHVDCTLGFGFSWITLFFNSPSRIVIRRNYTTSTNIFGSVGALPLGTVVGDPLISPVSTNDFPWHTGNTNDFSELQDYGDRRSSGVIVLDPGVIGMPPIASGGMADKEGVVGFEFLIGTNVHYGYIHFDFRRETGWWGGSGGYVLGWAYETTPNTPIAATPLAIPPTSLFTSVQKQADGVFDVSWRGTPGATYRVQGRPDWSAPFQDLTPDLVPVNETDASAVEFITTFSGLESTPSFFWRVVRTH